MKFELIIKEPEGDNKYLEATISDADGVTSFRFPTNDGNFRHHLDNFYHQISHTLRQRQFPLDTVVFAQKGEFAVCKGYPEESK